MNEQLLFVISDDLRSLAEAARPFFDRRDTAVRFAHDGVEALEWIRDEHPDLAILGLQMPKMNGDEVCNQVKSDPDLHQTPILIVADAIDPDILDQCLAIGCDDVVERSIDSAEMLKKVLRLLGLPVRRFPRIPVRLGVTGEQEALTFIGQSVDLSEEGVHLETHMELASGAHLSLAFSIPLTNQEIEAKGEIVWEISPKPWRRYGIRFLSISDTHRQAVREFVQTHSHWRG